MARESYENNEPFVSLNAVTATGDGDEVGFLPRQGEGGFPRTYTWETIITGGPSAVSIELEGCIGDPDTDANWLVVDTSTVVGGERKFVVDKKVRYLRAALQTLTGGTSPTVTAKILV